MFLRILGVENSIYVLNDNFFRSLCQFLASLWNKSEQAGFKYVSDRG